MNGRPRPRAVSRQIDAADGIEAQPSPGSGLGKRPQEQRRVDGLGQGDRHGGVGERRLKDEEKIERLPGEVGQAALDGLGVEQQVGGANELGLQALQGLPSPLHHVLGEGGVELGPGKDDKPDAGGQHAHDWMAKP